MRFWIDTEYHDTGKHVELISLGALAEDGREFYAISTEFNPDELLPWTKENVLPHLSPRDSGDWKSIQEIGSDFRAFVGDSPAEFWSYIATYDWYLVTRLLPYGLNGLPENWPFECWDLHQWAWRLGNPELPEPENEAHHALSDAHWHRQVYEFLEAYENSSRGMK